MYAVSPPTIPDFEFDDGDDGDDGDDVRMLPDFEDDDGGDGGGGDGGETSEMRMLPDFEDSDDEMTGTLPAMPLPAMPVPRDDLGVMSIPNGDDDVWTSNMGDYMSTIDPVYPAND